MRGEHLLQLRRSLTCRGADGQQHGGADQGEKYGKRKEEACRVLGRGERAWSKRRRRETVAVAQNKVIGKGGIPSGDTDEEHMAERDGAQVYREVEHARKSKGDEDDWE